MMIPAQSGYYSAEDKRSDLRLQAMPPAAERPSALQRNTTSAFRVPQECIIFATDKNGKDMEKVISVDGAGHFKDINDEAYERTRSELMDEVTACEDRTERRRLMLKLADFSMECHHESDALDVYFNLLRFGGCSAYEKDPQSVDAAYALKAYRAMQALSHSSDEYISEMASQLLSDVRKSFQQPLE